MLELEENTRLLQLLKAKISDLGDSLWRKWYETKIKGIRKKDNWT